MVIRQLVQQDKEKILQILKQRGTFNEMEIRVAMEVIDDCLRTQDRNDYNIFCACDGSNEVVGYICFGPIPMTDYCYDLYWIAVDERTSRKGIGESLLTFMEQFAGRKGAKKIYVETSSTQPYEAARSFYKKHLYDPVFVVNDFYHEGDHKMVFMKNICGLASPKNELAYAADGFL